MYRTQVLASVLMAIEQSLHGRVETFTFQAGVFGCVVLCEVDVVWDWWCLKQGNQEGESWLGGGAPLGLSEVRPRVLQWCKGAGQDATVPLNRYLRAIKVCCAVVKEHREK